VVRTQTPPHLLTAPEKHKPGSPVSPGLLLTFLACPRKVSKRKTPQLTRLMIRFPHCAEFNPSVTVVTWTPD